MIILLVKNNSTNLTRCSLGFSLAQIKTIQKMCPLFSFFQIQILFIQLTIIYKTQLCGFYCKFSYSTQSGLQKFIFKSMSYGYMLTVVELTAEPACSPICSTHTGRFDGHKIHRVGWAACADSPQGHWLQGHNL